MYTRAQKESSSVSPTSIHKKSNGSDGSRSFSVQRQPEINSSQEKERPSYSRNAADLLAANVMRSMEEGKDSDEMSLEAGVQTKLTVGAAGDKYEQEADQVAAQVMRMSVAPDNSPQVQRFGEEDNPVQRWSLAQSITPVVQRQVDEQVQMRSLVQRAFQAGGNQASADLESRLNASKGGGSALAPEVRSFMEPRFGADFSGVRVHTGGEAVQMNRELGSQAFAHGSDVYFGAGKSPGNNELTAHELTHVVQQGASSQLSRKVAQQEDTYQSQPSAISQTPQSLVQRDIKGSDPVPYGDFTIDMTKVENPGGKSGERGTVEFKPNTKAPNSKLIRLIQIVKTNDLGATPASDYNWLGGESDRNLMQTSPSSKSYKSKKGDTLQSISQIQCQGHITANEIYQANQAILTSSDPSVEIPEGTDLSIPKVQGGYFVDHAAADPKAVPRTNPKDPEVSPYYRDYWSNSSNSQNGSKQGKEIKEASLWDFPGGGSSFHIGFNFETVARSEDVGIDYGTIHWNFTLNKGKVEDESFHVQKGTSDTFEAALQEFNKFYKNPHTVMKGDTLWDISKKYYGTPDRWQDIYKANKDIIKDPNHIEPGWKLRLPDFST